MAIPHIHMRMEKIPINASNTTYRNMFSTSLL
jgi:hypothetical protein